MFGFKGHWEGIIEYDAKGIASGGNRNVDLSIAQLRGHKSPMKITFDLNGDGAPASYVNLTPPIKANIGNDNFAYGLYSNSYGNTATRGDGNITATLITAIWTGNGAFSPTTRRIQIKLFRPDLFFGIGVPLNVNTANDNSRSGIDASNYKQFPNMKMLSFNACQITEISKPLPKYIKYLLFKQCSALNSITAPFPTELEYLHMSQLLSGAVSNINTLLAPCTKLKYLHFYDPQAIPESFFWPKTVTLSGNLDLSNQTILEELLIIDNPSMTGITLANGLNTLKWFVARNCGLTSLAFVDDVLTGNTNLRIYDINQNVVNASRDYGNTDITTILEYFMVGNCKITGDVSITSSRTNMKQVVLGILANANDNTHDDVNISGCTSLRIFRWGSGTGTKRNITLTLPSSSVMTGIEVTGPRSTYLNLGTYSSTLTQCYLDNLEVNETNNPNLISQLNGLSGVSELRFRSHFGTPAFTNPDLSGCLALNILRIEGSGLIGTLTLHNHAMNFINVSGNPLLSGITGVHSSLQQFLINGTAINFDFSTLTQLSYLEANTLSAQTELNFTGKTSTVAINYGASYCSVLNTISLPNATDAAKVSSLNIQINSGLTTINNMDNLDYTAIAAATSRGFYCISNAVDMTFPIGENNFLAGTFQIQSNGMSQANVNGTIDSLYTHRRKNFGTGSKTANIAGTNSAPSGTYQAPTGFRTNLTKFTITNVTQANPAVMTVSSIGNLQNNDIIYVYGVSGMTQLNLNHYKIANISSNTFELQTEGGSNIDSSGYGAYTSAGNASSDGTASASSKEKTYVLVNNYGWTITQN